MALRDGLDPKGMRHISKIEDEEESEEESDNILTSVNGCPNFAWGMFAVPEDWKCTWYAVEAANQRIMIFH